MTPRLTRAGVSRLSLIALALFLALLSGRPELLLVAAPLLLNLVVALRGPGVPRYTLTHEVSDARLFEGDRLTVSITLGARTRIELIELLEPVPPSLSLFSGCNRAVFTLASGESRRWTYEVSCPERGRFVLGTVHARIWERSGLRTLETGHVDPKPLRVYPHVAPLRHVPQPLRTQTAIGNYVARSVGSGIEPGDIRPFAPGDQVRHVNWRASLRLGTLYVTQHHQERNADVILMLDTLSQVGAPPLTTLDLCVRAAASLARAYLARKDRVGMIDYGGALRWVKPGSGPAQLERLLDGLVAAHPLFTYVRKDLTMVPPRVLAPEALVIALSPLLDLRFVDAIRDLAARGFDVVVLSVSPIEVTRATVARSPLTDLACRVWALERRAQLDELRRQGLAILEWAPGEPIELALAMLGRCRRRIGMTA